MASLLVVVGALGGGSVRAEGPAIDVWYGPEQTFGSPGVPQRWVNILGNVSDPDGVASLSYQLNGGDLKPLSMGPDTRRLLMPGDFNIDIDYAALQPGANEVAIFATDANSNGSSSVVTVNYAAGNSWPLPYSTDWTTVETLSDAVQVVDGKWDFSSNGIRPVELGYDRLVAIGERFGWTDYEVTLPITIHGIDPAGYQWPSVAPGLALMLRWQGHTKWGEWQPWIFWRPNGASAWYYYGGGPHLELQGDARVIAADTSGRTLTHGVPYYWKVRVETIAGTGSFYSMRVWEVGTPEPIAWDLTGWQGTDDLPAGSLLLIAHHVDATFGNITVVPVVGTDPPFIFDEQALPEANWATVRWTTDVPADSRVEYGLTDSYEMGTVSDAALTLNHRIVLAGLEAETTYHFRMTSERPSGAAASTQDGTFSTLPLPPPSIVSDGFCCPILDTGLWTLVDPKGYGSYAMSGGHITLSVPQGVSHDLSTGGNSTLRIMQTIADADFEVEVGFDSATTERAQMQGIVVEQDADNYAYFAFSYEVAHTRAVGATVHAGHPVPRFSVAVPDGAPMYMRVERAGDTWTFRYSQDGTAWATAGSFSNVLTSSKAGVFAGNRGFNGDPPPAFTAIVDYFYSTADMQEGGTPRSCGARSDCATNGAPGPSGGGGDDVDGDDDSDGVPDSADRCPDTPFGETVDGSGCTVVQADEDDDGDDVVNAEDLCSDTPDGESADESGCSCSQRDGDGDSVNDCDDDCPGTPSGLAVDARGCPAGEDSDRDGIPDNLDRCPDTPAGESANENGCSCGERDADADGVNDCDDLCPDTPENEVAYVDGCSCSQADADNDGVNDCDDQCPGTKALAHVDSQGCPEATSGSSLGRGPRNTCGVLGTVNLVFLFSSMAAMRLIRRGAARRDLRVRHHGKLAQP